MELIKRFSDTIEMGLTWALGKGAGVLAIAATTFFGGSAGLALAALIPLGAAISTRLSFVSRNRDETRLLNQYREEIGQLLGILPEEVTRGHLRQVAAGNEKIDMPPNPTLRRELDGLNQNLRYSVIASVGAALITAAIMVPLGLSGGFDWLNNALFHGPNALFGGLAEFANSNFGAALAFTGVTLTAGLVDSVSKFSLKGIISDITESKNPAGRSAHDLVKAIDIEIQRDNTVSAEQVFGVLVAGNPELSNQVVRRYGADYQDLPANIQEQAIVAFGNMEAMDQLALDVTNRQIRPQALPFIANGQLDAVVRHDEPQPTKRAVMQARMREQAEALGQRVRPNTEQLSQSANEAMQRGVDRLSALTGRNVTPTQSHIAGVGMSSTYAERYTPNAPSTARPGTSFAAREDARRAEAALAQAQMA